MNPTARLRVVRALHRRAAAVASASALSLALVGEALAADLSEAEAAMRRGDATTGIRMLVEAASDGDARAAHALAEIHERGIGTPVDPDQAFRWRQLARELGYVAPPAPVAVPDRAPKAAPPAPGRNDERRREWRAEAPRAWSGWGWGGPFGYDPFFGPAWGPAYGYGWGPGWGGGPSIRFGYSQGWVW
jgi:hypothetical protein